MTDADAFCRKVEAAAVLFIYMWEEHGGRIALPDLHRTDKAAFTIRVQIHKYLRIVTDLGDGGIRMPSPDYGIIGAASGLVYKRADDGKEIRHHQIGGPCGLQP